MNNHSDKEIRDSIIGLGEKSVGKSYYPQLKRKIQEIEELNHSLEQRVQERTEELHRVIQKQQQTNKKLKSTLERLHHAQTKLVESEKMAALGGLVAGVAHEINTPVGVCITGISYFLELNINIQDEFKKGSIKRREFEEFLNSSSQIASTVFDNLKKTSHLINNFKQIAVEQSLQEITSFNLNENLHETVLSQAELIEQKAIQVEIKCDETLEIYSNPQALSQIISHLLVNSLVHGFANQQQGHIDIHVLNKESHITLYYRDNGHGVDEENQNKIFDPFFTTNRAAGDIGLGLNVVYNLVSKVLNGTIEYDNKIKDGLAFTLQFDEFENNFRNPS